MTYMMEWKATSSLILVQYIAVPPPQLGKVHQRALRPGRVMRPVGLGYLARPVEQIITRTSWLYSLFSS